MYVEYEGEGQDTSKQFVSKITEDDNVLPHLIEGVEVRVLAEFDHVLGRTSFECLKDKIGEYIMVYKNDCLEDTYVIESVERDEKTEAILKQEPIYKVGIGEPGKERWRIDNEC